MRDHSRGDDRVGIGVSMLIVLYALGFTNLFLRGSLGILAPELSSEMSLSPESLSLVASSFFFAYALMQIPSGMLLDRFGARRTLSSLLLFTTLGAALFSVATSASELIAARVLMGIGCAGIFSGAFFVVNQWVKPHEVVTKTGVLNSFASLGGLCATAPLAVLISIYSWRDCYWAFTAGVAILFVAVAVLLRDPPQAKAASQKPRERLSDIFAGVARAIAQPGIKRLIVVGVPMSMQTTLLGAWGAPYLRDVHGLDEIARGNVLLVMAVSSVFGHALMGLLARTLGTLKWVIIAGATSLFCLALTLAMVEQPPVWLVTVVFGIIGVAAMYPMLAFAHARALVPPDLIGRGIAVTNMGIMSAIAVSQLVFGWIVGQFPLNNGVPPELAYRTAFAVLAMLSGLAIIIYAPVSDNRLGGAGRRSR
ncbi:MAG: MFS transporter [Hyphomicrobiaceae bacterium]